MNASLQRLLRASRAALEQLYGNRLVRVVLFGSQARGEAEPGSDVDMLVVLQGEVDTGQEVSRLVDLETSLWDQYRTHTHFIPASEARYADALHPLMMNVHAEGLEV